MLQKKKEIFCILTINTNDSRNFSKILRIGVVRVNILDYQIKKPGQLGLTQKGNIAIQAGGLAGPRLLSILNIFLTINAIDDKFHDFY